MNPTSPKMWKMYERNFGTVAEGKNVFERVIEGFKSFYRGTSRVVQ